MIFTFFILGNINFWHKICRFYRKCEPLYHFLDFVPQLLLLFDHEGHVLVNGRGQNHVESFCFGGHVAHHLIVGEDVVPMQQTIVIHTLPAQGHLDVQPQKNRFQLANKK